MYLNITERKWECADRASDYVFSGRLQTDCQDESEPFDQVHAFDLTFNVIRYK